MIFLYRLLTIIVLIISPIIIILRLIKKKEHLSRYKEKFCFFSKKRKNGSLVWFHGSSVGEILSIIPIVEKLEKNNKINNILITSSTLSSSYVLSKLKFKKTIHQFFPIDTNYFSKKFLRYWQPSVAIFIESEIWPNMISNSKNKSIPLVLLNGRITKKSFKRWMKIPITAKKIFGSFDIVLPQNNETKSYLKLLGSKNIKLIGNLKFCDTKSVEKILIDKKLKKNFDLRKVWCAASTHKSEETICAIVHQKLKEKYKKILTIIIPRHVHRVDEIKNELKSLDLKIQLHSKNTKLNQNTDIYIVDTYGDTKKFFKNCKTVFLGGSLIEHGGQNPIEAARLGCKIIHGPHIDNFREVYKLLNKNKISYKIKDENQLFKLIDYSLIKKINSYKSIEKLDNIGIKILNQTYNELKKTIRF